MKTAYELSVLCLGFSEYEKRLLKSILIIGTSYEHRYYLCDITSLMPIQAAIINADDPRAINQWKTYCVGMPPLPAIMVSRNPAKQHGTYRAHWPLDAKELLGMLNRIALMRNAPHENRPRWQQTLQIVQKWFAQRAAVL